MGLYGETGAGLAEEQGIAHKIDIVSGTLGKAYGLVGGYIASSGTLLCSCYCSSFDSSITNCSVMLGNDFPKILFSSGPLVDVVRNYGSGLIFTTSIPPSTAAGAVASINILAGPEGRALRRRHRQSYTLLRQKLVSHKL